MFFSVTGDSFCHHDSQRFAGLFAKLFSQHKNICFWVPSHGCVDLKAVEILAAQSVT